MADRKRALYLVIMTVATLILGIAAVFIGLGLQDTTTPDTSFVSGNSNPPPNNPPPNNPPPNNPPPNNPPPNNPPPNNPPPNNPPPTNPPPAPSNVPPGSGGGDLPETAILSDEADATIIGAVLLLFGGYLYQHRKRGKVD